MSIRTRPTYRRHLGNGACPDDAQPDARDPRCPACRYDRAVEAVLKAARHAETVTYPGQDETSRLAMVALRRALEREAKARGAK